MVVLTRLDKTRRRYTEEPSSEAPFLTLAEYIKMAKGLIGAYASPSLSSVMLKDEDAIDFVAQQLMWGTIRWRADGGCSLRSYYVQRARYAIRTWIFKMARVKRRGIPYSLNAEYEDGNSNPIEFVDTIIDNRSDTREECRKTVVDLIDNSRTLTLREADCLKRRFVDYEPVESIKVDYKVSKQQIHNIFNSGIKKLQNEYQDREFSLPF